MRLLPERSTFTSHISKGQEHYQYANPGNRWSVVDRDIRSHGHESPTQGAKPEYSRKGQSRPLGIQRHRQRFEHHDTHEQQYEDHAQEPKLTSLSNHELVSSIIRVVETRCAWTNAKGVVEQHTQ